MTKGSTREEAAEIGKQYIATEGVPWYMPIRAEGGGWWLVFRCAELRLVTEEAIDAERPFSYSGIGALAEAIDKIKEPHRAVCSQCSKRAAK